MSIKALFVNSFAFIHHLLSLNFLVKTHFVKPLVSIRRERSLEICSHHNFVPNQMLIGSFRLYSWLIAPTGQDHAVHNTLQDLIYLPQRSKEINQK